MTKVPLELYNGELDLNILLKDSEKNKILISKLAASGDIVPSIDSGVRISLDEVNSRRPYAAFLVAQTLCAEQINYLTSKSDKSTKDKMMVAQYE